MLHISYTPAFYVIFYKHFCIFIKLWLEQCNFIGEEDRVHCNLFFVMWKVWKCHFCVLKQCRVSEQYTTIKLFSLFRMVSKLDIEMCLCCSLEILQRFYNIEYWQQFYLLGQKRKLPEFNFGNFLDVCVFALYSGDPVIGPTLSMQDSNTCSIQNCHAFMSCLYIHFYTNKFFTIQIRFPWFCWV